MNKDSESLLVLFESHKAFYEDKPILIEKGIIKPIGDKFFWTKSKTSLAEYFKKLGNNSYKTYTPGGFWAPIEFFFCCKRGSLRKLAGNNKESKDFKEIKKIVMEDREKNKQRKNEEEKGQRNIQAIHNIIINAGNTGEYIAAIEKIKKIIV